MQFCWLKFLNNDFLSSIFFSLDATQTKQSSTSTLTSTITSTSTTTNKRLANGNNGLNGYERCAKKAKIDDAKTTDYTSNIKQMKKFGDNYFYEDTDGFVHVYTDGACENNGRANAVAGYGVYFGEGHKL